ncbi:MAG: hypothetical protein V4690_04370 [Patescibacteria group bacterium]
MSVQNRILDVLYHNGPLDGSQIIAHTLTGEKDFLTAIRMLHAVGAVRRAVEEEFGRGKHVEENELLHVWDVVPEGDR